MPQPSVGGRMGVRAAATSWWTGASRGRGPSHISTDFPSRRTVIVCSVGLGQSGGARAVWWGSARDEPHRTTRTPPDCTKPTQRTVPIEQRAPGSALGTRNRRSAARFRRQDQPPPANPTRQRTAGAIGHPDPHRNRFGCPTGDCVVDQTPKPAPQQVRVPNRQSAGPIGHRTPHLTPRQQRHGPHR
jgi:hypothetical protein